MEYPTLATEVFSDGILEIDRVGIDFIHLLQFSSIHPFENRSDDDIGGTEEKRNFSVIKFPLIEEIAGDGVCVVDFPRIFPCIADGGERVIAEYDGVVLLQELRMEEDSVFQIELTESSRVFVFSECKELSRETHGFRFQSVRTEKERREIRSECFCEHDIETLGSTAVQEHIVDEADFVFWRHKDFFTPKYFDTYKLKVLLPQSYLPHILSYICISSQSLLVWINRSSFRYMGTQKVKRWFFESIARFLSNKWDCLVR